MNDRGLDVVRQLGSGSHGDVFEVRDRSTGERLALKVLREVERGWIVGFKREFRFLVDVRHPNLVGYHGLWTDGGAWYLLMDLIEGVELSSLMGPGAVGGSATTMAAAPTDEASTLDFPEDDEVSAGQRGLPGADQLVTDAPQAGGTMGEGREAATFELDSLAAPPVDTRPARHELDAILRIARGLARGLRAIHETGHLHRDLKPRNVMIRPDGEPVLLDFGLITATDDKGRLVMGTPRYMAPECLSPPVGPAADWYAYGLILFELLVGKPPAEGSGLSLVRQRRTFRAAAPSLWLPELPAALSDLVCALLHPDPLQRPSGAEVCAQLDIGEELDGLRSGPFVGRAAELEQLATAASAALDGCVSIVRLRAPTGMGKSALIDAFRRRLPPRALPLVSRCHSHESLPYKALDGAVDALSLALFEQGAVGLRSGAVASLVAAFPALRGRVEPGTRSGRVSLEEALVELMAAVCLERTPVLVIDDAQWGDADSARLLLHLLEGGPPMLVVIAHRDNEEGPFLVEMEPMLRHAVDISLEPLTLPEAQALAAGLQLPAGDDGQLESCLVQSQGHPYLLAELLREGRVDAELSSLIRSRLDAMGPAGRRLVDLVAVSPGALPERMLREVAEDGADRFREILATCRSQRLLRTGHADRELSLLPWHDRVREVCLGALSPAAAEQLHATLGRAWSVRDEADPEVLAVHWEGAGRLEEALASLRLARERATAAHAHAHAAILGRRIVALPGACDADRRLLVDALVASGQRRAAAPELLALAETASAVQARRDRRHAAEHLLRSGEFDRGIQLFHELAADAGIPLGGPRWLLILRVIIVRLRVWWRAYKPSPHTPNPPAELVERAELAGAVNRGLRFVATLDGVVPQAMGLLDALDIGDPARLLIPMANEVNTLAAGGPKGLVGVTALYDQVVGMMDRVEDVEARATTWLELAGAACLLGDFPEALRRIERGEAMMAETGDDLAQHIDLRFAYFATACWYTGEWEPLVRQTVRALRDAERRDDRWTAMWLRSAWVPAAQVLLGGSLADARAATRETIAAAGEIAPVLSSSATVTSLQLDLLDGDAAGALDRLEAAWPGLKSSFLLEAQLMRGSLAEARARAGVMLYAEGSKSPRGRSEAERAIAQLDEEAVPWMRGVARMAEAGLAAVDGEMDRCHAVLRAARTIVSGAGLGAHRAAIDVVFTPPTGPAGAVDLRLRHRLMLPGVPVPPAL